MRTSADDRQKSSKREVREKGHQRSGLGLVRTQPGRPLTKFVSGLEDHMPSWASRMCTQARAYHAPHWELGPAYWLNAARTGASFGRRRTSCSRRANSCAAHLVPQWSLLYRISAVRIGVSVGSRGDLKQLYWCTRFCFRCFLVGIMSCILLVSFLWDVSLVLMACTFPFSERSSEGKENCRSVLKWVLYSMRNSHVYFNTSAQPIVHIWLVNVHHILISLWWLTPTTQQLMHHTAVHMTVW